MFLGQIFNRNADPAVEESKEPLGAASPSETKRLSQTESKPSSLSRWSFHRRSAHGSSSDLSATKKKKSKKQSIRRSKKKKEDMIKHDTNIKTRNDSIKKESKPKIDEKIDKVSNQKNTTASKSPRQSGRKKNGKTKEWEQNKQKSNGTGSNRSMGTILSGSNHTLGANSIGLSEVFKGKITDGDDSVPEAGEISDFESMSDSGDSYQKDIEDENIKKDIEDDNITKETEQPKEVILKEPKLRKSKSLDLKKKKKKETERITDDILKEPKLVKSQSMDDLLKALESWKEESMDMSISIDDSFSLPFEDKSDMFDLNMSFTQPPINKKFDSMENLSEDGRALADIEDESEDEDMEEAERFEKNSESGSSVTTEDSIEESATTSPTAKDTSEPVVEEKPTEQQPEDKENSDCIEESEKLIEQQQPEDKENSECKEESIEDPPTVIETSRSEEDSVSQSEEDSVSQGTPAVTEASLSLEESDAQPENLKKSDYLTESKVDDVGIEEKWPVDEAPTNLERSKERSPLMRRRRTVRQSRLLRHSNLSKIRMSILQENLESEENTPPVMQNSIENSFRRNTRKPNAWRTSMVRTPPVPEQPAWTHDSGRLPVIEREETGPPTWLGESFMKTKKVVGRSLWMDVEHCTVDLGVY